MATGIPVSNILQPAAISQSSQNRQLMVDLQILKPQWYSKFTERYGNQDLTWWLSSTAGMELVKNRNFLPTKPKNSVLDPFSCDFNLRRPGVRVQRIIGEIHNERFHVGISSDIKRLP